MALCLLVERTNEADQCSLNRAGIETMWVNACSNVTALTFDADRNITAITVDAAAGKEFKKFEFEPDVGFLNQTKTRTANGRGGVNVAVQLSFNISGLSTTDSNALEALNAFKCLHAIVKDNNGVFRYVGVNFYDASATWSNSNLKTGDGSGNTGADPTNDLAEYVETLAANQNWYAREYTGEESAIPVPAAV